MEAVDRTRFRQAVPAKPADVGSREGAQSDFRSVLAEKTPPSRADERESDRDRKRDAAEEPASSPPAPTHVDALVGRFGRCAEPRAGAPLASLDQIVNQIVRQITVVNANGVDSLRVDLQLTSERLSVEVSLRAGRVCATLSTGDARLARRLDAALPTMTELIEARGVKLERVTVQQQTPSNGGDHPSGDRRRRPLLEPPLPVEKRRGTEAWADRFGSR